MLAKSNTVNTEDGLAEGKRIGDYVIYMKRLLGKHKLNLR